MTVERLRLVMAAVGAEPTARDLAEVVWLATQVSPSAVGPVIGAGQREPPPTVPPVVSAADAAPPPRPSPLPSPPPSRRPVSTKRLHAKTMPVVEGVQAVNVPVPKALALTDRLRLQRALRPLKATVPVGRMDALDEEATATRIASQRAPITVWEPVWQTATERRLEAVVVTDVSNSTLMWRQLAREIGDMLGQSGLFRNVGQCRLRELHGGAEAAVETWSGDRHHPEQLVDRSGRRVFFIVSDCVATMWHSGAVASVVRRWGRHDAVVVVQLLPERLWSRTGARTLAGTLIASRAGVANVGLDFVSFAGVERPSGMVVPVVDLSARRLGRWAKLVGTGRAQPGAATFLVGDEPLTLPQQPAAKPLEPLALVRRFRSSASSEAVNLARYVSLLSAPSLPVIQHIHQAMFRPARPAHLAEMLLSGLLRVDEQNSGVYQFVANVAELLRDSLTMSEQAKWLHLVEAAVSAQIARRIGAPGGSFGALTPGRGIDRIGVGSEPFAVLSVLNIRQPPALPPTAQIRPSAGLIPSEQQLRAARRLLLPETAAVPFTGRETEIAGLTRWCLGGEGGETRLMTGPTGIGKTRLALELVRICREAGWLVWFGDGERPAVDQGKHLLVVIDNADTRSVVVPPGLRPAPEGRLRLLVIGRSAGDWWHEQGIRAASEVIDPLASTGSLRQGAFAAALSGLAEAAGGVAGVQVRPPDGGASTLADEPGLTYCGAAFQALSVLESTNDVVSWIREAAASATLRQQQRYWERSAAARQFSYGASDELDGHLAVAALYGASSLTEAVQAIREFGDLDQAAAQRVAAWIRELFPGGQQHYWGPIGPAEVSQAFVLEVLSRNPGLLERVLPQVAPGQVRNALPLLLMACRMLPAMADPLWTAISHRASLVEDMWRTGIGTGETMPESLLDHLRTAVRSADIPLDVLSAIVVGLGDQSAVFRHVEPAVAEAMTSNYRRLAGALPERADTLAAALGWLVQSRTAHNRQGALVAAEERVLLYRRLVDAAGPVAAQGLMRSLGGALKTLADIQERSGMARAAAASAADALAVRSRMDFGSDDPLTVAAEMTQLSRLLHRLGDPAGALRAQEAVVAAYRRLHPGHAGVYARPLAEALTAQATQLRGLRRTDAAMSASAEAVAVFGGGGDLGDRAVALLCHAADLHAAGDQANALARIFEAISDVESTVDDPEERHRGLAMGHYCLAVQLSEVGQADEVLAELDTTIGHFRELVLLDPVRHRPGLALALSHRGKVRWSCGFAAPGRADLAEAIATCQRLLSAQPLNTLIHQRMTAWQADLVAWQAR